MKGYISLLPRRQGSLLFLFACAWVFVAKGQLHKRIFKTSFNSPGIKRNIRLESIYEESIWPMRVVD
jgi:hypothetical protein